MKYYLLVSTIRCQLYVVLCTSNLFDSVGWETRFLRTTCVQFAFIERDSKVIAQYTLLRVRWQNIRAPR